MLLSNFLSLSYFQIYARGLEEAFLISHVSTPDFYQYRCRQSRWFYSRRKYSYALHIISLFHQVFDLFYFFQIFVFNNVMVEKRLPLFKVYLEISIKSVSWKHLKENSLVTAPWLTMKNSVKWFNCKVTIVRKFISSCLMRKSLKKNTLKFMAFKLSSPPLLVYIYKNCS